jgi:tetratricopeptide (TPR) repeat protein
MYLLHFYPYNRGRPALNRMLLPPATIAFVVQNSCFAAIPTGIPAKSFFAEFVIHHRLARHTRQIVAISFFPITAARQLLFLATIATLLFRSVSAGSQEAPPAPQSPAQFDSLAARAAAARDQQNLPLAIQLYSQAEQLKPDWQEGWWYLGILQYTANQYAGAIDAFNHLLELAPTAVPAMALRGLCEFETAAYDDALRDLEQAVAHGALNEPRNEQIIRYHLALLLAHAARFQESLDQYRFFAEHQADAPDLRIGIALAGMRVASFPKDIAPQDRDFYQSVGDAGYVFLSGDNEHADAMFTELFARYPARPNLHYFYGFLLFPHDPSLAIDQFQSELAVNPANEIANALLALTLVIAGRFEEALAAARRAYTNSPDMEMAQLALGRSLAETGDTKGGLELLNRVLQSDPNNLEAHLGLLSIYSQSGNREEAARERKVCRDLAR